MTSISLGLEAIFSSNKSKPSVIKESINLDTISLLEMLRRVIFKESDSDTIILFVVSFGLGFLGPSE